jgi:hypothetical protein
VIEGRSDFARRTRGQGGQQDAPHRRAIGRQARPGAEIDRHHPAIGGSGDVEDFGIIEHRRRRALIDLAGQFFKEGLDQPRQRRCRQVGVTEVKHARRQAEELAVIAGIAQMDQSQQASPGRSALEAGTVGDIGDRLAGMLLVEALDDRQSLDQTVDDVAFAHGTSRRRRAAMS